MTLTFIVTVRVDEDMKDLTTHVSEAGSVPGLEFDGLKGLEAEILTRIKSALKRRTK